MVVIVVRMVAAAAVLVAATPTRKPIATLDALGPALTACFRAPEGSASSQLTVQVTLKADGSVLGRPRITFSHLVGTTERKQLFVAAVLRGLAACTPVAVTAGLGGAIAGRPFVLRFVGGGAVAADLKPVGIPVRPSAVRHPARP